MKIILTGAAGFIGSCFLRHLNKMGEEDVFVVDNTLESQESPNLSNKKFKAYMAKDELLSRLEKGQMKDVEFMIHLGACSSTTETNRDFLQQNNFQYSRSLASWALQNKIHFQYASSASVYGDGKKGFSDEDEQLKSFKPLNYYAESKWMFDEWLVKERWVEKVVGYRYFNVFGPNEYHKGDMKSMVAKAYEQIEKEGKAKLFATSRSGYPDGSETRDFVYSKDINKVMGYFLNHPDKFGIYNLGTGKPRTFKDLVVSVFKAMGREPEIEYVPMPEKLKKQYQYFTEADISKLREAGYSEEFMELEDSVADYVKNHLTQPHPIY